MIVAFCVKYGDGYCQQLFVDSDKFKSVALKRFIEDNDIVDVLCGYDGSKLIEACYESDPHSYSKVNGITVDEFQQEVTHPDDPYDNGIWVKPPVMVEKDIYVVMD